MASSMRSDKVGYGTWYDKMAARIIAREENLGRDVSLIRTESGIGASGLPHIGSLADAARSHAVAQAIAEQGYKSELIAFSDDMDGLRKVPTGLPDFLSKYIGYPVSTIPDPWKCHESYGNHMSSLLLEAMDRCGIEYRFESGTEIYRKGKLKDEIEILLSNAKRVGEIIKEEIGQEKYVEVLPYFPVCQRCGKIYTTRAYDFSAKEKKVFYRCEGTEISGKKIDGCGYEGEAKYQLGEGKLSWKTEFAARWRALDIRFEAYGKDIADSVRVNDRICREVLRYEPPLHARYEMFLDKGGRKISKSIGNVLTPQVWFRYGSPQSLMLLMLKRFVGTRTVSVEDIPRYMDELDELSDVYFNKRRVEDEKSKSKFVGLYTYCWALKPPKEWRPHVPFRLLVNLANVAPKDRAIEFIAEKLSDYGYNLDLRDFEERVKYAMNWVEDFKVVERPTIKLSFEEKKAIEELIELIENLDDEDEIQGAVFMTARKNSIKPGDLFRVLYKILLGSQEGPRFGPYVVTMGKERVISLLREALKKSQCTI
ncbi:MAG: lysine--tRNA ligase [Candidatus Bathyarchaeia archaeon]